MPGTLDPRGRLETVSICIQGGLILLLSCCRRHSPVASPSTWVPTLLFLFDNCSVDIDRRELRRDGELRAVEPQVFDLLEFLIRNRDRMVSRDDVLAAVWNGRIVSESTLASRINAARSAAGLQ
jgi:DNA-binding response OmpR family regulator